MGSFRQNLFLFSTIIFGCFLSETLCHKESYSYTVNANFILLTSFGFLEGGKANFEISVKDESPTLWFLVCDKSEYPSEFRENLASTCENLMEDAKEVCEENRLFTGKLNYTESIEKGGMYFFIIGNCYNYSTIQEYTLDVKYELVNPGGEQLSSEEIPYPSMYIVLIVVWMLITSIWMMNWIINRTQHIKLHKVISLLPLFKTIFCGAALYYWKVLNNTGIETKTLISIYGTFYILFELSFYLILLTISSGWGITRSYFHIRDKWVLSAIAIILSLSLTLSFIFRGYFSVLMLIMYVIIIVIIFRYTNSNILALRESRSLWNPPTNDNIVVSSSSDGTIAQTSSSPSDTPRRNSTDSHSSSGSDPNQVISSPLNTVHNKLTMFNYFKFILVGFLIMTWIILFIAILFLQYYQWIYTMLNECKKVLQVVIFICIGWTFRLRSVNLYYRLENEEEESAQFYNSPNNVEMSAPAPTVATTASVQ